MNARFFILAITFICGSALYARAQAQLLNFSFSFTGEGGGTVSGVIVGLQNNATSDPTDVIITAGTPDYGALPDITLPFDFNKEQGLLVNDGEFTVVDGLITGITGSGFSIYAPIIQVSIDLDNHNILSTQPGFNDLETLGAYNPHNSGGFLGVTYGAGTPDVAPEPSTYALTLGGLAVLAVYFRRKNTVRG